MARQCEQCATTVRNRSAVSGSASGKFQHGGEPSSRTEHPPSLADRFARIRHVVQHVADGHHIEPPVLERQRDRVSVTASTDPSLRSWLIAAGDVSSPTSRPRWPSPQSPQKRNQSPTRCPAASGSSRAQSRRAAPAQRPRDARNRAGGYRSASAAGRLTSARSQSSSSSSHQPNRPISTWAEAETSEPATGRATSRRSAMAGRRAAMRIRPASCARRVRMRRAPGLGHRREEVFDLSCVVQAYDRGGRRMALDRQVQAWQGSLTPPQHPAPEILPLRGSSERSPRASIDG